MAWVSRSERFASKSASDNVGPGSYLGHASHLSQIDPGYAPFGSLKGRPGNNENASGVAVSCGPAPGQYDPRLPGAYDPGLPKRSVPFGSTGARGWMGNGGAAPGPGQYSVGPREASKEGSRTMGAPHGEHKALFRSVSAPSIPVRHQSFGYEEVGDGRLIQQGPKNVASLLSGRPGDAAGPGHYEVHHGTAPVDRRTQGGRFLKSIRSKDLPPSSTPGPGHYVARRDDGRTVSSVFHSQSDRGFKLRDDNPAPGQYALEEDRPGRKNAREINPDLQYFNSTTERFRDRGMDPDPGPGSYAEPAKHVRLMTKPFCCSATRFTGPTKADKENPGPGCYDPAGVGATAGPLGSVSVLGAVGGLAFGSMEKKGNTFGSGKQEVPGPGSYTVPGTIPDAEADGPENKKKGRLYASFKSATPKDQLIKTMVKSGKQMPPPGAYDPIHRSDLGSVVRMPGKTEGFLSSADRISSTYKKVPGGPGQYDAPIEVSAGKKINSFNRSMLEGISNGRSKSLGFNAGDKRFKTEIPAKRNPGPGAYAATDGWNKRTYNIYFGDVG